MEKFSLRGLSKKEQDKKVIEREKIEKEISKCLQDIDRKYYFY